MIKVCAGQADRLRHLWVEVYIRYPRNRTLCLMWTRRMWATASIIPQPYRLITGSL